MKRRKQIGKLMYTPRWNQGDVKLGEDYLSLSRDEKLEALANWIGALLSARNAMIPNPKSWHHFTDKKSWHGLTAKERSELWASMDWSGMPEHAYGKAIEAKLKEKNT